MRSPQYLQRCACLACSGGLPCLCQGLASLRLNATTHFPGHCASSWQVLPSAAHPRTRLCQRGQLHPSLRCARSSFPPLNLNLCLLNCLPSATHSHAFFLLVCRLPYLHMPLTLDRPERWPPHAAATQARAAACPRALASSVPPCAGPLGRASCCPRGLVALRPTTCTCSPPKWVPLSRGG